MRAILEAWIYTMRRKAEESLTAVGEFNRGALLSVSIMQDSEGDRT